MAGYYGAGSGARHRTQVFDGQPQRSGRRPVRDDGRFGVRETDDQASSSPSRLRVMEASSGMPGPIVVDIVALEM